MDCRVKARLLLYASITLLAATPIPPLLFTTLAHVSLGFALAQAASMVILSLVPLLFLTDCIEGESSPV